ncbi:hypothetical protein GCM10009788_07880 [Nocardioides humi]|uniref:Uncharacterized protein n=2 Tax=Nocardioides humi TaxID=449461 RepID=A0ABN1ZX63_9ACTN
MPNTPGIGGYLMAWLVSILALPPLLAAAFKEPLGPGMAVVVGMYAAANSVPFACIGIPVVHLACRRVRSQSIHVVAAGAVGWVSAVLLMWPDPGYTSFAIALAGSTACGRLVVVPLVWRRRRWAGDSARSAARC